VEYYSTLLGRIPCLRGGRIIPSHIMPTEMDMNIRNPPINLTGSLFEKQELMVSRLKDIIVRVNA